MSDKKRKWNSDGNGGNALPGKSGAPPPTKVRKPDPNPLSQLLSQTSVKPQLPNQQPSTIGRSRELPIKRGREFSDAIKQLGRKNGDETVRAHFRMKLDLPDDKQQDFLVGGTFSVMQHPTTGLVQGNLKTHAKSSYVGKANWTKQVLPYELSLPRATIESRAIKHLENDDYDISAKSSAFNPGDLKIGKSTPLGMVAMGSYLEDVTAKRSIGLEHVGSAMRASVMAVKWNHKQGIRDAGKDFADNMLNAFPQLGNDKVKSDDMDKTGISELRKEFKSEDQFSKQDQLKSIRRAHQNAFSAAEMRFAKKIEAIQGAWGKDRSLSDTDALQSTAGKWLGGKGSEFSSLLEDFSSKDQLRSDKAKLQFGDIRKAYLQRKMDRHGIEIKVD